MKMATIRPITHSGHETTYTYEIKNGDRELIINAMLKSDVVVIEEDSEWVRFPNLKTALNYALNAPN